MLACLFVCFSYLLVCHSPIDSDESLPPPVALVTSAGPETLGAEVDGQRADVHAVHVVPQGQARGLTPGHAHCGTGQSGFAATGSRGRLEVDVVSTCESLWFSLCVMMFGMNCGAMRGVTVSMSAFLACHQCYCAGSSLAWGMNLRAVVCGIF